MTPPRILAAGSPTSSVGSAHRDFGGVGEAQLTASTLVERSAAQPDHARRSRPGLHGDPLTGACVPGDDAVHLDREPAAGGKDLKHDRLAGGDYHAAVVGRV